MSCAPLGPGCYADARGCLEEVTRKFIHWVAESNDAPSHTTPLEIKGLNDRANNVSQRMSGIEAIRDRESVEYANVSYVKLSRAVIEINSSIIVRDGSYPSNESRGNSRVIRMQAQRACCRKAVKSYKRECPLMRFSIGTAELPCHEPHVGVEIVGGTVASVQISPCASHEQVGLRDDAAEVEDL